MSDKEHDKILKDMEDAQNKNKRLKKMFKESHDKDGEPNISLVVGPTEKLKIIEKRIYDENVKVYWSIEDLLSFGFEEPSPNILLLLGRYVDPEEPGKTLKSVTPIFNFLSTNTMVILELPDDICKDGMVFKVYRSKRYPTPDPMLYDYLDIESGVKIFNNEPDIELNWLRPWFCKPKEKETTTEVTETNYINYETLVSSFLRWEPQHDVSYGSSTVDMLFNRTLILTGPKQTGKTTGLCKSVVNMLESDPYKVFGFFSINDSNLTLLKGRLKGLLKHSDLKIDYVNSLFNHCTPSTNESSPSNTKSYLLKVETKDVYKGRLTFRPKFDYIVIDPTYGTDIKDFLDLLLRLEVVKEKTKFIFVD